MPKIRTRRPPERQPSQFEQAVCVEGFSLGWSDPIPRGRVYPRTHPMVVQHPRYWRLLGPHPDEEVNANGKQEKQ